MEVKLIAYTPNPDGLANLCAETCVSKTIPTIKTSANGLRSLQEALDSHHESVIEHCSFTFAVSGVSRALTHQLVRHRIASYSQQSQRYVNMNEFDYVMPKSIEDNIDAYAKFYQAMDMIDYTYILLKDMGIPEEDARYILPNATCTNIIVTMNCRELHNFFKVRVCNRAQWEIRELATKMLALCKEVAPVIFENAGASFDVLGYCPEKRSCGRCQRFTDLKDKGSEGGQ